MRENKNTDKSDKLLGEILGVVFRDTYLYQCIYDSAELRKERISLLHEIVMGYNRISSEQLQDKIYSYGILIEEDELLARQVFLGLNVLVKRQREHKGK